MVAICNILGPEKNQTLKENDNVVLLVLSTHKEINETTNTMRASVFYLMSLKVLYLVMDSYKHGEQCNRNKSTPLDTLPQIHFLG